MVSESRLEGCRTYGLFAASEPEGDSIADDLYDEWLIELKESK
jgi:hypothetical protein